jgi:hypothetical protein
MNLGPARVDVGDAGAENPASTELWRKSDDDDSDPFSFALRSSSAFSAFSLAMVRISAQPINAPAARYSGCYQRP